MKVGPLAPHRTEMPAYQVRTKNSRDGKEGEARGGVQWILDRSKEQGSELPTGKKRSAEIEYLRAVEKKLTGTHPGRTYWR